jgi:hypothetical protein
LPVFALQTLDIHRFSPTVLLMTFLGFGVSHVHSVNNTARGQNPEVLARWTEKVGSFTRITLIPLVFLAGGVVLGRERT